jgi:hypothetical protein
MAFSGVTPRRARLRDNRLTRSAAVPLRQPLLFQPFERQAPFSFAEVVDETRAAWFPELEGEVETRVAALPSLASVWFHRMGFERHVVVFHPVLNRPDMPVEVVRFIAKHELTHLRVPAAGHPPEFWEAELAAGPERFAVWAWLNRNLNPPGTADSLGHSGLEGLATHHAEGYRPLHSAPAIRRCALARAVSGRRRAIAVCAGVGGHPASVRRPLIYPRIRVPRSRLGAYPHRSCSCGWKSKVSQSGGSFREVARRWWRSCRLL